MSANIEGSCDNNEDDEGDYNDAGDDEEEEVEEEEESLFSEDDISKQSSKTGFLPWTLKLNDNSSTMAN